MLEIVLQPPNNESGIMQVDMEMLRTWIGRTRESADVIAAWPAVGLAATLDRGDPLPQTGDPLPPLWHWIYFLEPAPASQLGPDGHPKRGGFLPPVPLPRRMWAGSRLRFEAPIRIGDTATRRSRIVDVSAKHGKSGDLVFVTVEHDISGPGGVAIREAHDIVYRNPPRADDPRRPPDSAPTGPWRREIRPDPVLLFRYSARTFNGHRIHYDQPYVIGEEGYPGLIVHGPLLATLMLDLLRRERPGASVRRFDFRVRRPVFDTGSFAMGGVPSVDGSSCRLWATDNDGVLAAEGEAEFGSG